MSKKAKVRTITIAKLYNTGNYEHVRYELSVEVPDGVSAKQTLLDAAGILACLKPIPKPYGLDGAKMRLAKLAETLTEREKEGLDEDRKLVGDYQIAIARRMDALDQLDQLGGKSRKGGGRKDDYEEEAPF